MRIYATWRNLAWENNDISQRHHWFPREMTSEIPYWWRVTCQIWVVFLIGWRNSLRRHDQLELRTKLD